MLRCIFMFHIHRIPVHVIRHNCGFLVMNIRPNQKWAIKWEITFLQCHHSHHNTNSTNRSWNPFLFYMQSPDHCSRRSSCNSGKETHFKALHETRKKTCKVFTFQRQQQRILNLRQASSRLRLIRVVSNAQTSPC